MTTEIFSCQVVWPMVPGALTTFRLFVAPVPSVMGVSSQRHLQLVATLVSNVTCIDPWPPGCVTPVPVFGRHLYLLAAREHIKVLATQHGHRGLCLQALPRVS